MPQRRPILILLGLIAFVILFHLLILLKIIPYEIAWGGRLQNDQQMLLFEMVSILINLFLAGVLLIKGRYIRPWLNEKTVNVILMVFIILFVFNSIGNLFAKTVFERYLAGLTFIFAVLLGIIRKTSLSPKT